MSGAVSAQLGIGTVGAKISLVPCNHFATTGAPFSSVGVWQSAQPATPFTKYSPWAICCLLAVLPGAAQPLSTIAIKPTTATTSTDVGFLIPPPENSSKFYSIVQK